MMLFREAMSDFPQINMIRDDPDFDVTLLVQYVRKSADAERNFLAGLFLSITVLDFLSDRCKIMKFNDRR